MFFSAIALTDSPFTPSWSFELVKLVFLSHVRDEIENLSKSKFFDVCHFGEPRMFVLWHWPSCRFLPCRFRTTGKNTKKKHFLSNFFWKCDILNVRFILDFSCPCKGEDVRLRTEGVLQRVNPPSLILNQFGIPPPGRLGTSPLPPLRLADSTLPLRQGKGGKYRMKMKLSFEIIACHI